MRIWGRHRGSSGILLGDADQEAVLAAALAFAFTGGERDAVSGGHLGFASRDGPAGSAPRRNFSGSVSVPEQPLFRALAGTAHRSKALKLTILILSLDMNKLAGPSCVWLQGVDNPQGYGNRRGCNGNSKIVC